MGARSVADLLEVLMSERTRLQKIMNNTKLDKKEISKAYWHFHTYGKDVERLTNLLKSGDETIWMN